MTRRATFLAASAAALAASELRAVAKGVDDSARMLAEIEAHSGGRLGVYARAGDGSAIAYRARERFPMCSTFKLLAVAAVLKRVDQGREQLGRYITYGRADLEAYAPITSKHIAAGKLTVAQLCEAAIVLSDNTAANLLLRSIGGPHQVTAFARSHPLNDAITRLDRNEPSLNTAIPGDPRDTTTPLRMAGDVAVLLTPEAVLASASSQQLERWMHDCKTGAATLRAGVPSDWYAGDKTGSGSNGTRNDVAIFRPPHRQPVFVAAYLTGASALDDDARDAVLAQVGRLVTAALT